jgi:hypothetical protein
MNTDREHSEQQTKKSRWGFRGMTVRDWLPIGGALLVPLVIALGSWAITWQLEKLENQRAEAERELAEQRAQDEALQAYLDQMSHLILERVMDPRRECWLPDGGRGKRRRRSATPPKRWVASRNPSPTA